MRRAGFARDDMRGLHGSLSSLQVSFGTSKVIPIDHQARRILKSLIVAKVLWQTSVSAQP
jgi:hypothetical protein